MKVSVIVPVYNVEKYIAKCLKSIQNQTLADFECLVINDGTKDNSIEVAKEAVGDDKRFIFYEKKNGGLSDARNFGLEKARGEYICFIDSDDYVDERLLEETYKAGIENGSDIVCFDMYYAYEDGRLEYSWGANFDGVSSFENNKEIIFMNNSANNKLYKTSFLSERRFYKGMWYEDLAVIPVWMAQANNVSHVAKPLYYYLQRQGSISHSADPRVFDIYKAISMVKESLKLSSEDVKGLYFKNCVVMTTLRIKDIDDKKTRMEYFKKNTQLLNQNYGCWYKDIKKEKDYTFKQRIVFWLIKNKHYYWLDQAYNKGN